MGSTTSDASGALKAALLGHFDRQRLRRVLDAVGFDATHWVRIVAYRQARAWLDELGIAALDTLETAPGHYWRQLPFRSYRPVSFPDFDICRAVLSERFDLIIADQVFEHVRTRWTAARNVLAMLRPGGHFLCFVPFLLKVHGYPDDCTRWTASGLRWLLRTRGSKRRRSGPGRGETVGARSPTSAMVGGCTASAGA
ncbi:MAG: methyltransferase domain-containing protein [Allosphingosinicella sp.]